MPKAKKRSFAKDVESALRRLLNDNPQDDLTANDLTGLLVGSKIIPPELLDGLRDKALTRYISTILRRATIETDDGDEARAFQNYTKFQQSEDGHELQLKIWKDIDNMSREQMVIAAKERAKHIKDSRACLAADLKYWNTKVRPRLGCAQIKLEF